MITGHDNVKYHDDGSIELLSGWAKLSPKPARLLTSPTSYWFKILSTNTDATMTVNFVRYNLNRVRGLFTFFKVDRSLVVTYGICYADGSRHCRSETLDLGDVEPFDGRCDIQLTFEMTADGVWCLILSFDDVDQGTFVYDYHNLNYRNDLLLEFELASVKKISSITCVY